MTPDIFFPIWGLILLVWGTIIAVFNEWAARFMRRVQSVWGRRAVDRITPRYVRFTGIVLAIGGIAFILLGLFHVFPKR